VAVRALIIIPATALAEVIIKATGSRQAHGYNLLDVDFHSRR
jgi:hypothetical protein